MTDENSIDWTLSITHNNDSTKYSLQNNGNKILIHTSMVPADIMNEYLWNISQPL